MRKLKAWKTACPAIGSDCGIVIEESASKAKYCSYLSAKDAGYDVSITDFKAVRAKEFDDATYCGKPIPPRKSFAMEFLK